MNVLKRQIVSVVKYLASVGCDCKARHNDGSKFFRFLVDALIFPLDALAAYGGMRSSGGSLSNLIWPRTFSAKLMFRKLFARSTRHIIWADKLAVRRHVAEKVGDQYLTSLAWAGTDLAQAKQCDLPARFLVKANHASGTNIIVDDLSAFDWQEAEKKTREWLSYDHSIGNGEWQYRWIIPKLLIETFLEGPDGGPPVDFKFFCFHGRVGFVQLDFDRFANHTRSLYDRSFTRLPFCLLYEQGTAQPEKPGCFDEMIQIAEKLADKEPFVRVDLYEVAGRPVFGELTLHPGSGGEPFKPHEWDYTWGKMM